MAKKRFNSEEKKKEYLSTVGQCIKDWAKVDTNLFQLCTVILEAGGPMSAVVYWRTPQVSSRISLVSDLMAARLVPTKLKPGQHAPKEFKRWQALRTELEVDLLPYRNFITHNPLWITWKAEDEASADGEQWYSPHWYTEQHLHDKLRRPKDFGDTGTKALQAHIEAVVRVAVELHELARELDKQRVARLLQESRLARYPSRADQDAELLGPPPRSSRA